MDKKSELIEKREKIQLAIEKISEVDKKLCTEFNRRNDEINRIRREIDQINLKKDNAYFSNRKLKESITDIKKSIENFEKYDIKKLENERKELSGKKSKLTENISDYKEIIRILGDSELKAYIIDTYIPIINQRMNYYLNILESDIKFEFDNTFNEVIKHRKRDNFAYESFSEGEKYRINLAILFSFRDLIQKTNESIFNLLILDEVLDSSADQDAIESLFKLIEFEFSDNNVAIISHRNHPYAGHTIHVSKPGNFSEIEQ